MFVSTVFHKINTKLIVNISGGFLLICSLYFLQSCQSKETNKPISPQSEEPVNAEIAFEKREIQTEEISQPQVANSETKDLKPLTEKIIVNATKSLPEKNEKEIKSRSNQLSENDDISGDYIYLTSEGNFVSSDEPQTLAYHNRSINEEKSEMTISPLTENNEENSLDVSIINVVKEGNEEKPNETEPLNPSSLETPALETKIQQNSIDYSPKEKVETTQSHIVINGQPLNSSEEFKEIKITDIKSIQILNEEDTQAVKEKSEILNVTQKIQQSNSDIVRLYLPDHTTHIYDALLINNNPEEIHPLYVIDGTRIEELDLYKAIVKRLNPDDIDSISFIKGNSAAPLYGQKAAEGALVINSKSGNLLQNIIRNSSGKPQKKFDKNNTKHKPSSSLVSNG